MIGKLRHIFDSLRRERGEWTVFAALQRTRRHWYHWDLVLSAPWMPPETTRFEDTELILGKLYEVTTLQERIDALGAILILREPAAVAVAAGELLNGQPIDHPVGLVRRKKFWFRDRFIRRGYIWAANLPEPVADTPAAAAPAA